MKRKRPNSSPNFGEKPLQFPAKTFFWSSPNFGEKTLRFPAKTIKFIQFRRRNYVIFYEILPHAKCVWPICKSVPPFKILQFKYRFYVHYCIIHSCLYEPGRGARRNVFRGGGGGNRRIHYLLGQSKPYSCNQDFAKRFEPKVKMILFKKSCNAGGMLSKLMQFKCIMDGGLGPKPLVAGQFSQFLEKITTLTPFGIGSHFERF